MPQNLIELLGVVVSINIFLLIYISGILSNKGISIWSLLKYMPHAIYYSFKSFGGNNKIANLNYPKN